MNDNGTFRDTEEEKRLWKNIASGAWAIWITEEIRKRLQGKHVMFDGMQRNEDVM